MRLIFGLLGAGLLLITSTAAAQISLADATVELRTAPLAPLSHGETVETKLDVRYAYAVTAVATGPTSIHLKIVEAPSWAVVSISPATLFAAVRPPLAGTTYSEYHAQGALLVAVTKDAPAGEVGILRLAAIAMPNGNVKGASGEGSLILTVAGSAVCEAPVVAHETEDEPTGLETATLGASPGPSLAAVAVSGVAGAAVGLAGARWLPRRKA